MTYLTKQGDTFDSIAFTIYGECRYTQGLMEANPKYLETVIFSAGITLKLPEIDIAETSSIQSPVWRE